MQSAARWGKKWFSWLEPVLQDSGGGNLPPGSLGGCLGYRVAVVTDGALPGWASSKHGGIFSLGLQIIVFASLLFALITCLLVLCAELQVKLLNCFDFCCITFSIYLYMAPWRRLVCTGNWTQFLSSVKWGQKWLSPYIAIQIWFYWNAPGEEGKLPLGDKTLHKIGAIIPSVTILGGFCIWMQLFASLVRNGGNIKDLPFVSDVLEWEVKLLKGRHYITYDWFFQALLHRYCVCSVCSN